MVVVEVIQESLWVEGALVVVAIYLNKVELNILNKNRFEMVTYVFFSGRRIFRHRDIVIAGDFLRAWR